MSFRSHVKKQPSPESEPLSPDEASVLLQARAALGDDFDRLPRDSIVQFVRGYIDEPDWAQTSIKYLKELVAWRDKERCDEILQPAGLPDKRELFERMWRTSVIGEDKEGHPVVVESLGRIPAAEFGEAFSEELFLRHCVYNKEALRKLCIHTSHRQQRRVYKFVVVLDLKGLSLRHTSRHFLHMVQTYISAFGNVYPESLKKLYMVNVPLIFAGAWAIIRPLLHPMTARKIALFSHLPKATKAMEEDGVTLGISLDDAYSSGASCSAIVAQHALASPSLRPFVPAVDLPLYEGDPLHAAALVAAARTAQPGSAGSFRGARTSFGRPGSAVRAGAPPAAGRLATVDEQVSPTAQAAEEAAALAAPVSRIDVSHLKGPPPPQPQLLPQPQRALTPKLVAQGQSAPEAPDLLEVTGTLELEGRRMVHFGLQLPSGSLVWFGSEPALLAHLVARSAPPSASSAASASASASGREGGSEAAMLGSLTLRRVHGGARHLLLMGEGGKALCVKRSTGAAQIELALAKQLGRPSPSVGAGQWVDLAAGSAAGASAAAAAQPEAARAEAGAQGAGAHSAAQPSSSGAPLAPAAPAALAPAAAPPTAAKPTPMPLVVAAAPARAAPPMALVLAIVVALCAANLAILGQWRLELTWD